MDDGAHSSTSESDDSKTDQNIEEESMSEETPAEDSSGDNQKRCLLMRAQKRKNKTRQN